MTLCCFSSISLIAFTQLYSLHVHVPCDLYKPIKFFLFTGCSQWEFSELHKSLSKMVVKVATELFNNYMHIFAVFSAKKKKNRFFTIMARKIRSTCLLES